MTGDPSLGAPGEAPGNAGPSGAPPPQRSGSARRKKRVRAAVQNALAEWRGDRPRPPAPKRKVKRVTPEARSASHHGGPGDPPTEDEALRILEEIEQSALGSAWLTTEPKVTVDASAPGVVAPLPRRKLIAPTTGSAAPSMARDVVFEPSFFLTISRMVIWLMGAFRYFSGTLLDVLIRRDTIERRARRLRLIFEGMGPTMIKLGQQLALRADVIPFAYCAELSKMLDRVPAFPTALAIERIERVTKKPLSETFAVFDPEPIGSASLACVYQAVRMNGDKVAVKVRRPGIGMLIAADLKALGWLMQLAEGITIIRPGMTYNLRVELKSMLMEELDFHREARNTELFLRRARKSRVKYVTAPKIHFDLSGDDVLVTEFIGGVFISEVLGALDRNDEAALHQLQIRGIDPKILARRMAKIFNWETLENLLFHADPHSANIIVRPGNVITFIDFGSCGRFTQRTRRQWMRVHYFLDAEDIAGVVDASIALMEPLPPVDIHRLTKELESLYWDWLYALKSQHAEWWERATGVLWLKLVSTARRYNVPMSLDTLRMFRTIFALDAVMYRLWSKLDPSREYWKYRKAAGRRAKKRVVRAIKSRLIHGLSGDDYMKIEEFWRMGDKLTARIQERLDTPDRRFMNMLGKAAFGATVMLRLFALALVIHLLAVASVVIYRDVARVPVALDEAFLSMISSVPYQVVMALFALLVVRRVLVRMSDVDVESR
ncbi:MAG: hypothetical protein IT384_15770 [Deltaproteobacteria bacterium]|nr:hypothetical protein [Deltaproteobacteria bacterium]